MFDKSFLEDEVRLGFYIPSIIKQAWAAQLEVLHVIEDICRKCNIEYFADWGTFLGAVRHHGYIPWDDDMDIVMRREDYEKFYAEAPNYFPEGYSIHTFRNEEGYREFHAVVVNSPSARFDKEHFDKFHGFNYMCGIDIFILDYVYPNESDEERRDKETLYLISLGDSILDDNLDNESIKSNLKRVEKITGVPLFDISDKKELAIKIYDLAEKKCAEVSRDESEILTQMVPWGLKKQLSRRYDKSEYDRNLRIPFENTTIPVPLFYDKMLSRRYGNYMIINKAVGAHDYPFFEKQKNDLEKLLGRKISEYSFDSKSLKKEKRSDDRFKTLLKEGLANLREINENIITYLDSIKTVNGSPYTNSSDLSINSIKEDIISAQELTIDIGNLIESIKGEDHPCISFFSSFCEKLYHLYNNSLTDFSDIKTSFDQMMSSVSQDILEKKVAVFLPFKGENWNSFETIYKSLYNNSNFEVYVIPIPYYFKSFDSTLTDEQYNLENYPGYLELQSYTEFPMEFLHPDYIFIQNPYDEFNASTSIHPSFYSSVIKNYTDNLIYIPWFKTCEIAENDYRAYKNMQYYVTVPGVVNADCVLLETKQEQKMYIKKLKEWSSIDKIWDSKICLIDTNTFDNLGIPYYFVEKNNAEKSVLYFIGAGTAIEHSDIFITKFKSNINLFTENEDKLKLTLVLDHLLEEALVKYAPNIYSEFKNIISSLSLKNVTIFYDNETVKNLTSCSSYYGDASFLASLYSFARKPVMIQNYKV